MRFGRDTSTVSNMENRLLQALRESEDRRDRHLVQAVKDISERIDSIAGATNGHTPDPNSLAGLSQRISRIETSVSFAQKVLLILIPVTAIIVTVVMAALR